MGTGASGYPRPEGQAATYWRRRFFALAAGLSVLALIAWAFSGAMGAGASNPAAGGGSGGQHGPSHGNGRPGAGGPGDGGRGAGASSARSATPSAPARSARPSASAGAIGASGAGRKQGGSKAAGSPTLRAGSTGQVGRKPPRCRRSDVVLSLSAGQHSFGPRALPRFDVFVVSTAAGSCSFNVGARHVRLLIKAGGTRIWGSADCVDGPGSLVTELRRGVPTVLPISWDRQQSSPGCKVSSARAPVGGYTAIAVDGANASNSVTFRLTARAA